MKIIHNQTNINGFPLALALVKLTSHIDCGLTAVTKVRHDQSFQMRVNCVERRELTHYRTRTRNSHLSIYLTLWSTQPLKYIRA